LGTNLALHKHITASTTCPTTKPAASAVDGVLSHNSKWCSHTYPSFIKIDLGSIQPVGSFVLKNAGLGGETTAWNTNTYNIQLSINNVNWTTVVRATGNQDSRIYKHIKQRPARYVRLNITKATNTTDTATRLYELEVYSGSGT
jgi:hypothetical protein